MLTKVHLLFLMLTEVLVTKKIDKG